jgi:hypothetical protein
MAKIFISHSSKDKEFVRQLKKDLEEFGHEIWLDEREIKTEIPFLQKFKKEYLKPII